jgi:hypothetical protein
MPDNERPDQVLRAMSEQEIRLNCLMVAANARTYLQGRMADPITVASEFYAWVQSGEKPAPAKPMFSGRPAPVTPGYATSEPPTDESERARRYGPTADLLDVRE